MNQYIFDKLQVLDLHKKDLLAALKRWGQSMIALLVAAIWAVWLIGPKTGAGLIDLGHYLVPAEARALILGTDSAEILTADESSKFYEKNIVEIKDQKVSEYLANKYQVSKIITTNIARDARLIGEEIGIDSYLILSIAATQTRLNPYYKNEKGGLGIMKISSNGQKINTNEDTDPRKNMRKGAIAIKRLLSTGYSLEETILEYVKDVSNKNTPTANKNLIIKEYNQLKKIGLGDT
jgi:hypothetical protein